MSWEQNKVCRTCLETTLPMMSIFKGSPVNSEILCVADMLKSFTSINAIPDSNMPEMVCLNCVREISRCYTFKIKCEVSSNSLQELLKDINIDENEEIVSNVTSKNMDCYIAIDKLKTESINDQQLDDFEHEIDGLHEGTIELKEKPKELFKKSGLSNDPLKKNFDQTPELTNRDIKNIEIINEVRKYHCIYDGTDRGYRNQNTRGKAWQKISKAVDLRVNICQRRWKQIRDHYVKLVNSGSTEIEKRYEWPLLKYIEFLNDHIRKKAALKDNEDETMLNPEEQLTAWQKSSIQLVQEVEKFKCLYDKDFGEYNDLKLLRTKAWHEIGLKMNMPDKLCHKRWKSIRDRYVTICRCASENGETSNKWHLFNYIQFLNKHLRQKSTRPKIIAEIPSDCEPIEVDVTEITYDANFDDPKFDNSFDSY